MNIIEFLNSYKGDYVFVNNNYYLRIYINKDKTINMNSLYNVNFGGLLQDIMLKLGVQINTTLYSKLLTTKKFKKFLLEEFKDNLMVEPYDELFNDISYNRGVIKISLSELQNTYLENKKVFTSKAKPPILFYDIINISKPVMNGNYIIMDVMMKSDWTNVMIKDFYTKNKIDIINSVKEYYNYYNEKAKIKKLLPLNYYKIGDVTSTQGSLRIILELKAPLTEMEEEIQNTN